MARLSYPNRDWLQMKYDSRLTDALDSQQNAINHIAEQLGASAVGATTPPPTISAVTVSKTTNGSLQAVIQDNTPVNWGIHYFLEHSTTPNFTQPHVIHLGQSRTWIGPDVSKDFPYWRAYSMYPGQSDQSTAVYHRGVIATAPVLPSTGSGTASGNGQQGGQGFGLAAKRTPPQRNPVPNK